MFSATRSTILSFTASRSVADTDDRTAFSAHSALRPRSTRDGPREGRGVVLDLLGHLLVGSPAPHRHRVRGADVRGRRHRGHVRGHGDEHTRGCRPRAGRAHVDDDGHLGVQDGLDDGAHRALEAAGRIELEDEGLRPLGSGRAPPRCATSRTVTGVIAPSISITATGAGAADAGAHGSTARRRTAKPKARRAVSGAEFMAAPRPHDSTRRAEV